MTREKAAALVAEMTLAEKADLCSGAGVWRLPAVPRLGLPSITLTDGPHGVRKAAPGTHSGLARNLPATCFPTASALASSWDVELLREIGTALGAEAAAADVAVLLGPGMNIKRHPLCGRNFEYFSEDPLLSGHLAAAMIDGIQSRGVGACVKHFAANDQEHRRMVVDVIADARTLREIHLRGFEIAVRRARPWTVMCAYNRINGVYCSENDWLLNTVLRGDWGFKGAVMTDWGAANDRVRGIAAGNDLEMPASGGVNDRRVAAAVRRGELDEATLDGKVARVVELVLKSKARAASPSAEVLADAHHALAHRAAAEGAVLLKNEETALPLRRDARIAVIGAFAKQPRYQGTGSSRVTPTRLDCAFDAMRNIVGTDAADTLLYAPGYDPELSEPDAKLIQDARSVATEADVAVVFAGLPTVYESEAFDRAHMRLPEQHGRLIEAVCAANPNTVVVLVNGAPVEMPWVHAPNAIIEAYLGGQAGGPAVADILFGRRAPCGKLAETFPLRQPDVPSDPWFPGANRQVQYREGLHIGYRHFDSFERPVLFPFGHGLSYTRFDYGNLHVTQAQPHSVSLTLTNAGDADGAEIVQVYVHRVAGAGPYRPEQELRGFRKVMLTAGESQSLRIGLDEHAFAFYDVESEEWTPAPGEYEIRVGASSRDIRLRQRLVVDAADDTRQAPQPNIDQGPAFVDGHLRVDDETFAAMLGKPIPPPEDARPFHLNSTLGEVETTWLGRLVAKRFKANFAKRMGGRDAATQKMIERMADETPLRLLVLSSGGKLGFATAEAFVAAMNGRYLKALGLLAGRR